jgi:hypothetical protein
MSTMLTLGTIQEATNTAAVTSYLEEAVLPATDWTLLQVKRRYSRLEPPEAYWAMYRIKLGRGEPIMPEPDDELDEDAPEPQPIYPEEREVRLVARAAFKPDLWDHFAGRIQNLYGGRQGDQLNGHGYPVLFPETQHAFWFYPVDPSMPTLGAAASPSRVLRLFRSMKRGLLDAPARITGVDVKLARYVPEVNGIFEYQVRTNPQAAAKRVFGKVQFGHRGRRTHEVMSALWEVARKSEGRLVIPRPLSYQPDLALFLEDAAPGAAVSGDRTASHFLAGVVFAAESLAAVHESGIRADRTATIEHELDRLHGVQDQFAHVHPKAHFLLRELLIHVRSRLARTPEEEWLPTHGDLKYDQFLYDGERFTLIDFDFFTQAETSNDLARFCSYLYPSMPKGWEQSVAAEEARKAFLDRYRELRPRATLQRFQIWEAIMLGNRAMTAMWAQQRGWERAVEGLLVMAMERLNSRLP